MDKEMLYAFADEDSEDIDALLEDEEDDEDEDFEDDNFEGEDEEETEDPLS